MLTNLKINKNEITLVYRECCEKGVFKHPEWGKCSFCYRTENPEVYKMIFI